jgi:hypothetical protein
LSSRDRKDGSLRRKQEMNSLEQEEKLHRRDTDDDEGI